MSRKVLGGLIQCSTPFTDPSAFVSRTTVEFGCAEPGATTFVEMKDARPERVVLMASGGLSHFPGTDRYASPDFDYDRRVLERLEAGRGGELAAVTGEELDRAGNIELRTWITLLGAVGAVPAHVYCYEPSWHHGNAVVEWPL